MNKEEIEGQLKLSKRQNKYERYDYLCSEFNGIDYCIKLEKYTNKLQQENQELKKENQEYKRLGFKHLNDKCNKLEKQLEDKEDFITKLQATKDKLDKWDRENYYQQKEFIKFLEEKEKQFDLECNPICAGVTKGYLSKYKEIIGENND